MTTKTKTTTKMKTINIAPQQEAGKVQPKTKVAALIEVLSKQGGATLAECAEALSFKGATVDASMATQWIRYDLCKVKGYGIAQKGTTLKLLKPKLKKAA